MVLATNWICGSEINVGKQSVHSVAIDSLPSKTISLNSPSIAAAFSRTGSCGLGRLAKYHCIPLRNAIRYRDAATTALADPLTGAGNRIALSNTLQREIELAKRYDQSMAVLMLDIDHLSCINERYGHSCGDEPRHLVNAAQRNSWVRCCIPSRR